jgi:tetratricopeptide (TPR) repeat protein/tRNA A-37 threonylcarbamoyl transferase component Bud32
MSTPRTVVCPHCQTRLRVPEAPGDRLRLRCRHCQQAFVVRLDAGAAARVTLAPGTASPTLTGAAASGSTTGRPAEASPPAAGENPADSPASRPAPGPPTVAMAAPPTPPAASGPRTAIPGGREPLTPSLLTGAPSDDRHRQPVFAPDALVAGRYRILRFIARGGVGEVYEAEDRELHQRVALKTIRHDHADGAHHLERFRREIQLARAVTHPNVCRIFDIGHHEAPGWTAAGPEGRITFLTMELLAGETLGDRLRRDGPMALAAALPLVTQMAEALGAAHRAGIVHRDFKCGNVVLCPAPGGGERAVVTDFGLARGLETRGDVGLTVSNPGDIVGTPAYMAPEQLQAGTISPATDLYALGIVLYEMLTGNLPFVGDTALSTAVKRLTDPPTPPRTWLPDLDPRAERAILRCLERDPAARPQTTAELLSLLTAPETAPAAAGSAAGPERADRALTESSADAATAGFPLRPATAGRTPVREAESGAAAVARQAERPSPPPERRRLRRLLATLALLVALAALLEARRRVPWVAELTGAPPLPRQSVAVLGFRNQTGSSEQEWLSTALAEMLATELAASRRVRPIPGELVAQAKKDLALTAVDTLAEDSLRRLRELLAADFVVLGSYTALGGGADAQLRLDLRLQDARDGEIVAGLSERGTVDQLFDLVSRSGEALRSELGDRARPAAALATGGLPRNPEAARYYAEALGRLHDYDPAAARDLLERAATAEPDNALVRSALAAAWGSLGYTAKAQEQAQRAVELAANLPDSERLAVEGRLFETLEQWSRAAASYQRLVALEPDNLDYGLRLVRSETAAGNPTAALLALDALRKLPAPANEDPRLDLAEAATALAVGDFTRQREAAARAATKGRERGARLLLADARSTECWALRNLGQASEAGRACEEALELYRVSGNPFGVATTAANLAAVRFDQGDHEAARALYQETLDLYRERGNQGGIALAYNNLAVLLRRQGDLAAARGLYEQSLTICRDTGNRVGEAHALNNLGSVLFELGDLAAARPMFEQTLAIRRETSDQSGVAFALHNLASVDRRAGDLAAARLGYEEALAIRRQSGQKLAEATTLNALARTLLDGGALATARQRAEEALALATSGGFRSAEASSLSILGEASLAAGDLAGAGERQQAALELRTTLGEKGAAAESRLALAGVALERGDFPTALSLAAEAAQQFASEQARDGEGLAHLMAARAELGRGETAAARAEVAVAQALLAGTQTRLASLQLALLDGRAQASSGNAAGALVKLRELAAAAQTAGFTPLALEARLFLGRMELARGNVAAGRGELERVVAASAEAGLGLLERKARGFLG